MLDENSRLLSPLVYPCYAVKSASGDGGLVEVIGDGKVALIVLTDDAALDDYRREQGREDREAITFADASEFHFFLNKIFLSDVTHICFDPPKNRNARSYLSLHEVMAAVEVDIAAGEA